MTFGQFVGSGEYIRDREDCDRCHRKWDCRKCARARWIDLDNPDGSPKMVELSVWQVDMRESIAETWRAESALLSAISRTGDGTLVSWFEDEAGPA